MSRENPISVTFPREQSSENARPHRRFAVAGLDGEALEPERFLADTEESPPPPPPGRRRRHHSSAAQAAEASESENREHLPAIPNRTTPPTSIAPTEETSIFLPPVRTSRKK